MRDDKPLTKWARRAQELNQRPGLVRAAKVARELLPGDSALGESRAASGSAPSDALVRYVAETPGAPSAVRELGLSALQLYQALSEAQGRGRGDRDVAILFTDLVEFSAWALGAGDASALELLETVSGAVEPAIKAHDGTVVKRLGDGHMAAFGHAADAVRAAHDAQEQLREVEVAGYRPALRAGVHLGRPRRLRRDYLGVDVNIAARVAAAASGGEILVSEPARAQLDEATFAARGRGPFSAKGAPRDLEVYSVEVRAQRPCCGRAAGP